MPDARFLGTFKSISMGYETNKNERKHPHETSSLCVSRIAIEIGSIEKIAVASGSAIRNGILTI